MRADSWHIAETNIDGEDTTDINDITDINDMCGSVRGCSVCIAAVLTYCIGCLHVNDGNTTTHMTRVYVHVRSATTESRSV